MVDVEDKVIEYARAGAPLRDRGCGQATGRRRLTLKAYRLEGAEAAYEPVQVNERGWAWLEPLGLWLGVKVNPDTGGRLALFDPETGFGDRRLHGDPRRARCGHARADACRKSCPTPRPRPGTTPKPVPTPDPARADAEAVPTREPRPAPTPKPVPGPGPGPVPTPRPTAQAGRLHGSEAKILVRRPDQSTGRPRNLSDDASLTANGILGEGSPIVQSSLDLFHRLAPTLRNREQRKYF